MSAAVLGAIVFNYWQADHKYKEIAASADVAGDSLADMKVDWASLRATNPDIVGWICIPGTVVNYPLVWSGDNETYLHKSFSGDTGFAGSCGAIFLDGSDKPDFSDENNIIYGHHLNDGTMFACLSDLADQAVFDAHRTVYVLTPTMNYRLTTFSLVLTNGNDALAQEVFANQASFQSYVQDKIDRSVVMPAEGMPSVSSIDKIFTLSTCDYTQYNGRAILFSRVAEKAAPDATASAVSSSGDAQVAVDASSGETK